jgi:hypothetical protein
MTKIVALRLTLAVDDAVELKHLKPVLAQLLAQQGTVQIQTNGTSEARVHWSTVEVLQGPERVPRHTKPGKTPPDAAQSLRL